MAFCGRISEDGGKSVKVEGHIPKEILILPKGNRARRIGINFRYDPALLENCRAPDEP
jgi:hypothetical protein